MNDQPGSERSIFLDALELAAPEEREAFLSRACGNDSQLRREVEALLKAHDRMARPPAAGAATQAAKVGEGVGQMVGPFKLLETIGEGGMGTVWMAQQTHPVRRLVALKVIKPGMDSRQVVARFEAERQALALMDHPNIAKVLDGGTTPEGLPYFVMELVKGVPITHYCDQRRLTPKERLELFAQVCQAVQHAHQKGIIHRDIKPSNVLVALYDGVPVPKVIDFGVAKAAGQPLTDKTLVTGFGVVVGTLEYMSPEQAELNQLDIDTRSDVYSLGVLLYELLTGTTPISRKRLREGALLEVLRIIREEEPPKPSQRLSTTQELPTIAANRSLEPKRLAGLVRGELDWIVMKALEKDRNRRYETANGLVKDLERYLRDEPVLACPPSVGYRLGKFARRHKAPLAAAALVSAALVLAVVVLAVSNVQVRQEQQLTEGERQKTAAALSREQEARSQLDEALGTVRTEQEATRKALDREQYAHYVSQIALADRKWWGGDPVGAELVLDACDVARRDWEWHYLKRRGHAELLASPTQVRVLQDLAFSPDGRYLAACGGEKVVRLLDAATGQEVRTLSLLSGGGALRVTFSPDGRLLAASSIDGWVRLWDVETGRPGHAIKAHSQRVVGLAFSPDGRTLASAGEDRMLKLWDAATGALAQQIQAQGSVLTNDVIFSPDGSTLAMANGDQILLWDLKKAQELRSFQQPMHRVFGVAFSPDGKSLASAGTDHTLRLWDLATGQTTRILTGHTDMVTRVTFAPDGKRLASAGHDGTVRVWDADPGLELITYRLSTMPASAAVFSPDGKRLATGSNDGAIKVWDADQRPECRAFPLPAGSFPDQVAFSPDGTRLATGGPGKAAEVWDAATGARLWSRPSQRLDPVGVAFSSDGRRVGAVGNGVATVWDAQSGEEVHTFRGPKGIIQAVAFSPDGRRVATAGSDLVVRLWDAATGQELASLGGHAALPGECLAFSPDGRHLASAETKGPILIWDVASGSRLRTLTGHNNRVTAVAFSPDGRSLASSSYDSTVKLWDLADGHVRWTLTVPFSQVRTVAFTPLVERNGNRHMRLATGGTDRVVKIWDAETGQELLSLSGHMTAVYCAAFSPDGHRLFTGDLKGKLLIWDATPWDRLPPDKANSKPD